MVPSRIEHRAHRAGGGRRAVARHGGAIVDECSAAWRTSSPLSDAAGPDPHIFRSDPNGQRLRGRRLGDDAEPEVVGGVLRRVGLARCSARSSHRTASCRRGLLQFAVRPEVELRLVVRPCQSFVHSHTLPCIVGAHLFAGNLPAGNVFSYAARPRAGHERVSTFAASAGSCAAAERCGCQPALLPFGFRRQPEPHRRVPGVDAGEEGVHLVKSTCSTGTSRTR